MHSIVLLSLTQLLDELIIAQSIRESWPCLSCLLMRKQRYGNIYWHDRNLLFTNLCSSTANEINIYLFFCLRNVFLCSIPQILLTICHYIISNFVVFTLPKRHKGLSWISEKIHIKKKQPVFVWAFVWKNKKKKIFGKLP